MTESEKASARSAFLKHLKEGQRQRRADTWKIDVYKHLLRGYGLSLEMLNVFKDDLTQEPELVLRETLQDYGELKAIYPVRVQVTLPDLLYRPLDNPAINAFCKIKNIDPFRDGAGVVFPVTGNGDWILHTLGYPNGSLCGKSYIIIYSNSRKDRNILAESLDQFINTRKKANE
jgi:hypothetical protein